MSKRLLWFFMEEEANEASEDVRKNELIDKYDWNPNVRHSNEELQELFDKIFPNKERS